VSSFSACDQSLVALPGPPLRACEISYARVRMCAWHFEQPHLPVALVQPDSPEESVLVSPLPAPGMVVEADWDAGCVAWAAFDELCGWC
jgi:hypothetical protein